MNIQTSSSYPKGLNFITGIGFQFGVIILTFILVIYYNISFFLYVPPTGIWLYYKDETKAEVEIFDLTPGSPGEEAGLEIGDKIITIGGRIITDLNVPIHQFLKAGDTELYIVQRGKETLEIPVVVTSYLEHPEYLIDIVPPLLLSVSVYGLGLVLLLLSPAADIRARLVALVWILAGTALASSGLGYMACAYFATNVTELTFVISNFFSVAAHLYFPVASFSNRTRSNILWGVLAITGITIAAYGIEQVYYFSQDQHPTFTASKSIIHILFFLAWVMNIGLLVRNYYFVKERETKRQTGIILAGTVIGLLPFLALTVLPYLLFGPEYIVVPGEISIISLVFIPISYGYVIYQRRLLKVDFIINRVLVLFLMAISLLSVSVLALGLLSMFLNFPPQVAVIGGILCVVIAIPSATLQKRIQIQVDRTLYGGYYDFVTVTADLSNRLAQTMDSRTFIEVLTVDLAQVMQIEQNAILLVVGDCLELHTNDMGEIPFSVSVLNDEVCKVLSSSHAPILAPNIWGLIDRKTAEQWAVFIWAQLFVPLFHGDTLHGILILGDRSTGDIYSNQDVQIIHTVSQQAALSIANIKLVDSLRGLARQLVRSNEEQRRVVARDLHDDVLQHLFFIKNRLSTADAELTELMGSAIIRLRQTIRAQRPSLLDRGLEVALKDLVDEMGKLAAGKTTIRWHNMLKSLPSLTDEETTSLYRIVQESLSNALKHADADGVAVTLKEENGYLEVEIKDDGIGIEKPNQLELAGHYGLLGMQERAAMIGAKLIISSGFEAGTTVTVKLKQPVH